MSPHEFAVIDLETTGLSPGYHHRVIEVAIIHVGRDGRQQTSWNTLVNPQRDVGPAHIHGLTAADLLDAPTFEDVAGDIADRLRGRIVVAHNLSFDATFLAAEYQRLGIQVPVSPTTGLCTMRMASHYLKATGRGLQACCSCIGHSILTAHSALYDAIAASTLLKYYLCHTPAFVEDWGESLSGMAALDWPAIPVYGVAPVVRQHRNAGPREHFLGKLVSRSEGTGYPPQANNYLELLDRVLLDRHISLHEEAELVSAAVSLGLSRENAIHCHRFYLSSLVRVALEDGVLTADEREDLNSVATLLGLRATDVDAALETAGTRDVRQRATAFSLSSGDSIVFTGEAQGMDRVSLEYQAKGLGLKPTGSVSKKTRVVVAADPDSMSGKAQKARTLGIPIVGYPFYFQLIEQHMRALHQTQRS
jgi:DNA polymerase-3 subunit epsilon